MHLMQYQLHPAFGAAGPNHRNAGDAVHDAACNPRETADEGNE